jgi:Flp pilus assembly pilin Flp
MRKLLAGLCRQLHRDDGQDLIEYAMLCALIALVAMGAVTSVGNVINQALWQVIAAANV